MGEWVEWLRLLVRPQTYLEAGDPWVRPSPPTRLPQLHNHQPISLCFVVRPLDSTSIPTTWQCEHKTPYECSFFSLPIILQLYNLQQLHTWPCPSFSPPSRRRSFPHSSLSPSDHPPRWYQLPPPAHWTRTRSNTCTYNFIIPSTQACPAGICGRGLSSVALLFSCGSGNRCCRLLGQGQVIPNPPQQTP